MIVRKGSILGGDANATDTRLLHFWASRAKEIYLFGGLVVPLGCHIGYRLAWVPLCCYIVILGRFMGDLGYQNIEILVALASLNHG